ncbi:MAG: L-fucose/L-arabinose isomerase family protein [Gammaproteobacteria bacterium]
MLTYGVAVLARPTFDVPFAEATKERAFAALEAAGIRTVGPRGLLFDRAAAEQAVAEIAAAGPIDLLLILQVTFTDATMTVKLAREATVPLAVWALPEPRIGGRLRLNAYCGLNLAAHALGRADVPHGSLYADPDAPAIGESLRALARVHAIPPSVAQPPSAAAAIASTAGSSIAAADAAAARVLGTLADSKITVVGRHPDGFDTCEYDPALLARLTGMRVDQVELPDLFARARATDPARVAAVRERVEAQVAGVTEVDAEQLDRSFRVFCALEDVQRDTGAKGLAVRCWPEMFTEYGCAACGPMAMMNQKKVPSACEADVNGSMTQLILQELAGEPAWMADLVDITAADDTAVLWHCGLAPLSMCDPEFKPEATIHTNRRMPLLHQFPIKPGRITLARLSRSRNALKLVIGGAEVLRAPMAFTGCSGTVRFDRPAGEVSQRILDEALEHHFALAYGDHREALRALARRWQVPVLELA